MSNYPNMSGGYYCSPFPGVKFSIALLRTAEEIPPVDHEIDHGGGRL